MSRFVRCLAAFAAGLGLLACHPAAQPPPRPPPPTLELTPQTEAALQALYADSAADGLVVAVALGDKAAVRGFGHLGHGDPRKPDGATLVRLDSISKLFASQLLARLVVAHKAALSDPLTRYAPPGWAPAMKDPPPITLEQLATHTSGLPRVYPLGIYETPPSAEEANHLWPRRTQSAPSLFAVVPIHTGFEPGYSGSVIAKQLRMSPRTSGNK